VSEHRFPFSAVVGQEDLKLALLLNAVDPAVGGVLLRGQKGSAKTTLARGLAALLPGAAPFVELPVGATEDRLVGTLDLAAALTEGSRRFQPGLLAAAHGGVLYVDEVNLLPDHLVDVLLDVAASGVNRVERESISHTHASRFVLIGSMNPEEGELRPQLLDRFGLAVEVAASSDPRQRAEAVRRRLAFDAEPSRFLADWGRAEADLGERLSTARPAPVPDGLLEQVSRLCASVGAEGLRADLTICRAAAALAGWEGRASATVADVRRVAPLALAHRRRRSPLESPGIDPDVLDQAIDDSAPGAADPRPGGDDPGGGDRGGGDPGGSPDQDDRVAAPPDPTGVVRLSADAAGALPLDAPASGRRTTVEGARGRLVADRAAEGPIRSLALGATVRAAAARRSGSAPAGPLVEPGGSSPAEPSRRAGPLVEPGDLREAVRQQRAANLVVLAVDASGSMGADRRMEAAKGAVLSLLLDAYQRRDLVALVTFRGDRAEVALKPTGSVEVARARLGQLPTGGRTPLAAGIAAALDLALAPARATTHRPLLVVVTDGRATSGPDGTDPVQAAEDAAAAVRRRRVSSVVIDAEDGPTRLGLARALAETMGARYLTVPELSSGALDAVIRGATA
jgi:magnesium chelatase subunit D